MSAPNQRKVTFLLNFLRSNVANFSFSYSPPILFYINPVSQCDQVRNVSEIIHDQHFPITISSSSVVSFSQKNIVTYETFLVP